MGFAAGVEAGRGIAADRRQQKQDELTRLQQNIETNAETGALQFNQQGQMQKDLETEVLKAQLDALKASTAQLDSQVSADAISNTITSVTDGDWHNARLNFNKVKSKLKNAKTLDVSDISPINFNDPKDVEQLRQLGVDTNVTSGDTEVQDAMNRSFMKVTGLDGNTRISPIDSVMKATNTWNMLTTQQRDRYTENANRVNGILKGAGVTSQQEKLSEQAQEIKGMQLEQVVAYQNEMKTAVESGDMKQVQAIFDKYNPIATKPTSMADKKAKYELTMTMNNDKVIDFAYNNPTEFSKMLETGSMDDIVSKDGMSLYNVARKVQGDAKIDVGRKTYLEGMVSTIENTSRLRTKLNKSDMDWDAVSKAMDEVTKVTGDGWRNLDPKEKAAMLERFNFDSDLKTVMAGYIKAMSGAAVSDEERKFYEKAILGGNWSTKEAAISSMDGFLSGLKGGMKVSLDGMKLNTPADYLSYKNRIDKIATPEPMVTPEYKPVVKEQSRVEKVKAGISTLWDKVNPPKPKTAADY